MVVTRGVGVSGRAGAVSTFCDRLFLRRAVRRPLQIVRGYWQTERAPGDATRAPMSTATSGSSGGGAVQPLDVSLRQQVSAKLGGLGVFAAIVIVLGVVLVFVVRSLTRVVSRWRDQQHASGAAPPASSEDDVTADSRDDLDDDNAPLPPPVTAAEAAAAVGSTAALRARGRQLEKKYAAYNAALDAHLEQRDATERAPRDRMDARVFGAPGADRWAYPQGA